MVFGGMGDRAFVVFVLGHGSRPDTASFGPVVRHAGGQNRRLHDATSASAGLDETIREALGIGDGLVALELVRRFTNFSTGWCLRVGCRYWPMVMKSTFGGAQIVHELEDLVALLAKPDHDARLGETCPDRVP